MHRNFKTACVLPTLVERQRNCSEARVAARMRGKYFYSKTNHMYNISNLFYFGTTLYMFRTVSPSIIRSLRLYIQRKVYVQS
jgi:hypothetical protein